MNQFDIKERRISLHGLGSQNSLRQLSTNLTKMDFLGTISSSLWIGVKLTIFFKKDFEWRKHGFPRRGSDSAVLIFLVFSYFTRLQQVFLLHMITAVTAFLLGVMDMFSMLDSVSERIKASVLVISVFVPWVSEHNSISFPLLFILFGTAQFLRRPLKLKEYLREVRINFGPAYVLVVIGTWLKCANGVSSSKLPLAAALCSFVAGFFLRPDNAEILKLCGIRVPTETKRKVSHAFLMFFSFICTAKYFLSSQSFSWTSKAVVQVGVAANSLLFFGAAYSPYILKDAILNFTINLLPEKYASVLIQ